MLHIAQAGEQETERAKEKAHARSVFCSPAPPLPFSRTSPLSPSLPPSLSPSLPPSSARAIFLSRSLLRSRSPVFFRSAFSFSFSLARSSSLTHTRPLSLSLFLTVSLSIPPRRARCLLQIQCSRADSLASAREAQGQSFCRWRRGGSCAVPRRVYSQEYCTRAACHVTRSVYISAQQTHTHTHKHTHACTHPHTHKQYTYI